MRNVVVTEVFGVANTQLWKAYLLKLQHIARALRDRQNCPWATKICPDLLQMEEALPFVQLDRCANEVLLLHGTEAEAAHDIARQGFDGRLSRRALYGSGVYLTVDACKAADPQYCGNQATSFMIVARAILGHPFLAQGPMPKHNRPPWVEGTDILHDSTIAIPGIPTGKGNGKGKRLQQQHWEFVLPDSQLYPQYIVKFTRQETAPH